MKRSIRELRRAVAAIPPQELLKLACEMVVTCQTGQYGEAEEKSSNPIIQLAAYQLVPCSFMMPHLNVSQMLLAKIRKHESSGRRAPLRQDYSLSRDQKFHRLDELIGAFIQVPEILYQIPEKLLTVYEIDEAINIFLHGPSQVLADASHVAYSALCFGVPLYSLRQWPFGLSGSSVSEMDCQRASKVDHQPASKIDQGVPVFILI